MPHTDAQWAWFLFYTGGSAVGWLLLLREVAMMVRRH